jgi:hypothetical protein
MTKHHCERLTTIWYCLVVLAAVAGYFLNLHQVQWHQDTVGEVISGTCLARFGSDEHGVRLPLLNLRGYGDFKEPAFSYLLALVFDFFKPSVVAARIVSLSLGLSGLVACVLFARRLISRPAYRWSAISFFCFGLLSLWLLGPQYFACAPALSVPLALLLIWTSKNILDDPASLGSGLAFGVVTAIMPYTYPSMKFLSATNSILIAILHLRKNGTAGLKLRNAKGLYCAGALILAAALPFILDALTHQQGLYRPGQVIENNPLTMLANLAGMFNPLSLFFQLPGQSSYATGYGGLLNPVFLPFVTLGLGHCLHQAFRGSRFAVYLLLFTVLAMIPASMVRAEFMPSTPHRNLIAFPAFIILAFYGAETATGYFKGRLGTVSFALVVCLWIFGGYESYKIVRQISRSLTVCVDFSKSVYMREIPPAWNGPDRLVPCNDFTPKTAYYRYYRLVEKGDTCYCNAPVAGGEGR